MEKTSRSSNNTCRKQVSGKTQLCPRLSISNADKVKLDIAIRLSDHNKIDNYYTCQESSLGGRGGETSRL